MNHVKIRLLLAVLLVFSTVAWADDIAIISLSGTPSGHSNYDLSGYRFTNSNDINVTELGLWASSGTLNDGHFVGIFNTSGNLLASLNLSAGTAGDANGFAWGTLSSPFTLSAGTWIVAGYYNQNSSDLFQAGDFGNAALTMNSGITFNGGQLWFNSNSPFDPTNPNSGTSTFAAGPNRIAFIGPNFQYTEGATSPVPEPASFMLLGTGLVAAAGSVRRKFNK
ncbi:MAG: hypothetical protein JWO20_3091 [Candidatus Angelobacter sp.]|jgi:hypothetical protein|nr:hypothetical protein [Candidatus Angelobacter sp.]